MSILLWRESKYGETELDQITAEEDEQEEEFTNYSMLGWASQTWLCDQPVAVPN